MQTTTFGAMQTPKSEDNDPTALNRGGSILAKTEIICDSMSGTEAASGTWTLLTF